MSLNPARSVARLGEKDRSRQIAFSTHLPLPPEEVFAFFAEADNLQRITPPELRFEIVERPPGGLRSGARIRYRLRLAGVRFGWLTEITRWEPPLAFVDEQLEGPYRSWVHTHAFVPEGQGTRVLDEVQYRLPLWPAGELASPLVRLQLRRVFAFRERAIREALLGDAA